VQKVLEEELLRLLPDAASAADMRQAQQRLEQAVAEVFAVLRRGLG